MLSQICFHKVASQGFLLGVFELGANLACLSPAGVESSDSREFTGHVTIAKLSKIRTKKRNSGVKLKKIAEVSFLGGIATLMRHILRTFALLLASHHFVTCLSSRHGKLLCLKPDGTMF